MNKAIVIDTNGYSAFKRGDSEAVRLIHSAQTVVVTSIVLGEILAGFRLGKNKETNHKELEAFLSDPKVFFLAINAQTAEEYANIYLELRQKGTPIPTNDMWIGAVSRQLGIPVFTLDKHFSKIDNLKIIRTEGELGA